MSDRNNGDLTKLLTDSFDYDGKDKIVSWEEIRKSIDAGAQQECFFSRIPSLDKYLEGFERGELIALSGARKSGKTLLAQSIDRGFWQNNVRSLWLQYEVTQKQFVRSYPDSVNLDMCFTPRKMKAHVLNWARDRIAEAVAKKGVSVVFIDHLHFLFDIGRMRNTSLEIGTVIRYLKFLAVDLNLVIFILCHMRKTNIDVEPTDMDFRDSSLISQESDVGLIVWRVKDSERQAWLKICYSRRTGTWEKKVALAKGINSLLVEETNE